MLGHSKPATTLNIYAHLLPGDQEEALRRLELAIGGEMSNAMSAESGKIRFVLRKRIW